MKPRLQLVKPRRLNRQVAPQRGPNEDYRKREYLTAAARAFAEATGPADLNRRLEAAFPSYGGTAMQGLQNFYLYPSASL